MYSYFLLTTEIMDQILTLMAILGGFTIFSMGLCISNSIEAKKSKRNYNIMFVIFLLGLASFLIGFFGVLIRTLFL